MRLLAALLILPASVAAILWLAASQFGGSQATPDAAGEDDPGRQVYMTRCISCHQANGKGITGYFPPLDGTEWVAEESGRLIRIILHGMTGPTTVQGVDYNGAM
ncbi:MAG: cytochrome c, partial [Rhodothermales bacterium]|nr:cytochrome c [Rhodothermales bacterium]